MSDVKPNRLREGDRLPEFGGTIEHVAIREGGIVEIWFREDTLAPLGFRPDYPDTIKTERH